MYQYSYCTNCFITRTVPMQYGTLGAARAGNYEYGKVRCSYGRGPDNGMPLSS